jgi:N-acetylmuramoyl-L-alanine amidase
MLSDIDCHSIVVEICFCDNADDVMKYQSNFNKLAYAMANVILEYV